jgi:hypothetical protein
MQKSGQKLRGEEEVCMNNYIHWFIDQIIYESCSILIRLSNIKQVKVAFCRCSFSSKHVLKYEKTPISPGKYTPGHP